MMITYRPYQTEDDFWKMRTFLREVFVLNGYRERAWHVARLEYVRWYTCLNCHNLTLNDVAHLWEADGELIAIAMPDGGPDEAHFMIHPDYENMAAATAAISRIRTTIIGRLPGQNFGNLTWTAAWSFKPASKIKCQKAF